jgi:hypothetical protein
VNKFSNVAFVLVVLGGISGSVPADASFLAEAASKSKQLPLTSGDGGGGGMFDGFVQAIIVAIDQYAEAAFGKTRVLSE